jgi:fumarylacetoacetase
VSAPPPTRRVSPHADPRRSSWVASANASGTDFPIQNLPIGRFSRPDGRARAGFAIGDSILDVEEALARRLYAGKAADAADAVRDQPLNALLAMPHEYFVDLLLQTSDLLDARSDRSRDARSAAEHVLCRMEQATMLLPAHIPNYTDFFAGIHHARAVGALLHKDGDALPPNYKWVPIAYHGRASSVRASGEAVRRPLGQRKVGDDVVFGRCERLDIELEMGFFIRGSNAIGDPVPMGEAGNRIFGLCLLNDWSARDIQGWEMHPLGPFLGKNFSTTISPWIVTAEALSPFRAPAMVREAGDPRLLDYLWDDEDQAAGGLDIDLEVLLRTERMRAAGESPVAIIRSNARHLYWTIAQMVAHHAVGGCNLVPGDLIGTGTISGPERDQLSSLLELTFGGREPCRLPNGELRRFLEDGDEITFRARCSRDGFVPIGFGECKGLILPALSAARN